MTKRSVAVVVLVAGLALTLNACGSDKKSSTSSPTTAAPGTTGAPPASYSGDKNSRFCQIAVEFSQRFQSLPGTLQGTAETLKAEINTLKGIVDQVKAAAPAAVKSDVDTLANAFSQYYSRLEATNYDPTAAAGELGKLATSDVSLAGQHLEAYGAQVCGIGTPSSTP